MFSIESLIRIIDLFGKRNLFFWNAALVLFSVALVLVFFIRTLISDKSDLKKRLSGWPFRFFLIGIICILISFAEGMGISFGSRIDALRNNSLPSSDTILYSEHIQNETGTLNIRVYGKKIYIADKQCQDVDAMTVLVDDLYKDSLQVVLLDDYAEYNTYIAVRDSLNRIGIHPNEKRITSSIGDNK